MQLLYTSILYTNLFFFFFFNDTATTEIYTLSLHDALPICSDSVTRIAFAPDEGIAGIVVRTRETDRKSTRLNSSHLVISYAVFCLKKKKKHRCPCRSRNSAA